LFFITSFLLCEKGQVFSTIINKGAFFIIMGSYSTIFVAMLPLVFAGAGLLKGFAITTIIGASIGVFLVRPTYAAVVEILLNQ